MTQSDDAGPRRVLIVDDNPFNRELLKRILTTQGLAVDEAHNGKEGLAKVAQTAYAMIFMDLLMPGMDGYEAIGRIRGMGVRCPIIIVSAMSSAEDRRRCLEAGGDDFLPKPIDMEGVGALIRKYEAYRPPSGAAAGPGTAGETDGVPGLPGYGVLLVEDDDATARRFSRFLGDHRFETTRFRRGDEALERFEASPHRYPIIISNIFASGIDGMGILARVKRSHPSVLVFIYAQDYDTETFQLALQLGADGVLTEGDFEETLLDRVESAVRLAARRGSRTQTASTASQVRKAQAHLIQYGCARPCADIDIAYSPLTDAGGDLACCRRFNLAGRCGVFLGDVAGHSVMSSYISAFYLGVLTSRWDRNQEPMALMRTINAELNRSSYHQYHLCAGAGLWDRRRRRLDLATAGVPGPLTVTLDDAFEPFFGHRPGGGMCLGLLRKEDLFVSDSLPFSTGDYLFLYSDGIRKKHLMEVIASGEISFDRPSAAGLGREILDRLLETWGQDDDMILIVLRAPPDGPEPGRRYQCRGGYEGVDAACRWAEEILTPERLPPGKDPLFVSLALREALINAVNHGNGLRPEGVVDLDIHAAPGRVRIDVSDQGPGFEMPEAVEPLEKIRLLRDGGRGLSVIHTVADRVETAGGTLSLIFEETGPGRGPTPRRRSRSI